MERPIQTVFRQAFSTRRRSKVNQLQKQNTFVRLPCRCVDNDAHDPSRMYDHGRHYFFAGKSTAVDADLNTRALSGATVGEATGLTTYGGWLQLKSESPAPADAPSTYDLPDLGNGPHFFYGLQWWFFGALAVFGFCYLAWDELRQRGNKRTSRGRRSERPEHAAVHGQHRPADEG